MALTFNKSNPESAVVQPAAQPAGEGAAAALPREPLNPLAHLGIQGTLVTVDSGRRRRSRRLEADVLFNRFWVISRPALAALVAEYKAGYDDDEDDEQDCPPYLLTEDGIACIPIMGPLSKKMTWRGMAYSEIAGMVQHAMSNSACKSILLCVDSPGGEVSGMFECCDFLYSLRGTKPMVAISDDSAYSAAYCLATAADKVFVVQTGGVGSIGCWMAHVDISKMLDQAGVKVTLISAGDKKVDGNQFEPLSDRAYADMKAEADRIREMFVGAVARNRSVSADALMATEAGIFMGAAGIPLLADNLGTVQDAMTYLRGKMVEENPDNPQVPEEGDDLGVSATQQALVTPDGKFKLTWTPMEVGVGPITMTGVQVGTSAFAAAVPYQKAPTSDAAWDGPKAKANLKSDQRAAYYRKAFAWQQGGSDGTKKNQFKFIHHFVGTDGDVGDASTAACSAGIAVLNGGRSGTTIPAADRKGVYNHLAGHLRAAGKTPPPLKSETEMAAQVGQWDSVETSLLSGIWDASGALIEHEPFSGGWIADDKFASFNTSTDGWADAKYAEAPSISIFGQPGVILAVRTMPANCLASAPADSGRKLTMLAVPYDGSICNLGAFDERYAPGCFSFGLDHDPRVLFGHNEEKILGRKSAGTARFWESSAGVHAEVESVPDTTYANDMLVSMKRGDVTQASAAFWILQSSWEIRGDRRIRVVERAILRDASVVAFAAYTNTSAQVQQASASAGRSVDLLKKRLSLLSI